MEKFNVAAVQMNALKDDLQHNLDVHVRFIEEAAEAGCSLIVFPELSTTAHYGDPEVVKFSETAGDGPISVLMKEKAGKHELIIAYGFCERAHGTFYNSHALVNGEGIIGLQRKVHASGDEYYSFRMGRRFEVFDLGFCRVGTLICYDVSFSEAWRVMALKGAEVVLGPSAGRKGGMAQNAPSDEQLKRLSDTLDALPGPTGTYAAENALYAVNCNQFGYNGHSTHKGGASIIDPTGKVIARSEPLLEDLMITATLDPEPAEEMRRGKGFSLRTRRPEIYGELTKMI